MVAKKKVSFLISFLLAASVLGGCAKSAESTSQKTLKDNKVIKIGVTQFVEHPALDAARKGFIEALKSKGYEDGKNIKIDFQNAQGDMPTTQTIAQKFVSEKEDLILAIATPSAQAAYNATKDIPILITAVTDPVKAGLAKSLENSGSNVTGTSDNLPIEKQFELLKKLVPNAKRVGILYNTSENNSEIQVESAKKAAPSFGLEIVTAGLTNVNEVTQSLNSLMGKIDVLYVPTDNVVVSAMPLIANGCFSKNIPIIGSERGQVTQGALATTGIDYNKLGYQTGLMAVEIIEGKKPNEIPITMLKDMQLVINEDAAKKLNIKIPEDLNSKAEKVTGGVN
ncbi:ABC transporter substrate-binding protein [Clostridium magnum]|uniref:ABC transporter substrate binding protein n=1 Tax=Clostridium magnum DSM 2767 TaxID=1121326 RepID=A0A161XDP3_9CLOT|nr:ABC transporter substrate-binding protein [Clostridium magnum]KZL92456.1 ABC transporter substrate binding protein [Clostridium magnum DSM 2767]SHI26619.1 putative ABC transport system substrate-binding protein [Clostridium magnum DSM 2767]